MCVVSHSKHKCICHWQKLWSIYFLQSLNYETFYLFLLPCKTFMSEKKCLNVCCCCPMKTQILWGCAGAQGPGTGTQRCQEVGGPGEEAEADGGAGPEEERRQQRDTAALNHAWPHCSTAEHFWVWASCGADEVYLSHCTQLDLDTASLIQGFLMTLPCFHWWINFNILATEVSN